MSTENPFAQENQQQAPPPAEDYPRSSPEDFTDMDDDWGEAEAATSGGNVPDGNYQVEVAKASQESARNSGDPMVKWDLVVLSGDHIGRHIFKNTMIKREHLKFLKGELTILNCCPNKLSELHLALQHAVGRQLEVTVRTKPGTGDRANENFTNTYFNKLLEQQEGGSNGGSF